MVSARLNRAATQHLLTAAAIWTTALVGAHAHADRPSVQVQFEVNVPSFAQLYAQPDAAKALTERLSRQLERRLGFAVWSASSPVAGAKLGRLVMRLDQDPDTRPMPRIFVSWFGASPDNQAKDLNMSTIEVYAPTNPGWDTNDRGAFEAQLLQAAMPTVDTDAFRDVLVEKFFRRLPIASAVELQAADRVVEIPIRWNEFLLASDSKLSVQFTRLAPPTTGSLLVSFVGPRVAPVDAAGEFPARVRGTITEARVDGQPIALTQNWNDTLPQVLADTKTTWTIFEYKPRDEVLNPTGEVLGL